VFVEIEQRPFAVSLLGDRGGRWQRAIFPMDKLVVDMFGLDDDDLFTLAQSRGNTGDFAVPRKLLAWRQSVGDAAF
jgi:hypothetical protein